MNVFFTALTNFIVQVLTALGISASRRVALIGAILAVSGGLIVGFARIINGLFQLGSASLPSWASSAALLLPSNTSVCITAVLTAKFARFMYDWHIKNLQIASSVN